MTGWAKAKVAAKYAGVSERTFRDWIRSGELRHTRLPTGTILTKYEFVDEYLAKFEVDDGGDVCGIVNEVMGQVVLKTKGCA